jgi:hypothetical protein
MVLQGKTIMKHGDFLLMLERANDPLSALLTATVPQLKVTLAVVINVLKGMILLPHKTREKLRPLEV